MGHFLCDGIRLLNHVHEACGDGIARHAVELGRFRGLYDYDAVLFLDGADAIGSVRPGSGQNDSYRAVFLGGRKGAEENINRVVDHFYVIFGQMEYV